MLFEHWFEYFSHMARQSFPFSNWFDEFERKIVTKRDDYYLNRFDIIRYLIGKETKEQHYYSKTLQSIFQKIKIILLERISYFIFEIDNSNKIDKE